MAPHPSRWVAPLAASHWAAVERIYQQGIDTGMATFESTAPSWDSFAKGKIPELGFVALGSEQQIIGWTAASPVSARWAYRGVIEHSVYVDPAFSGQGVASDLLDALAEKAASGGYWMIQSSIFAQNHASRALHRKSGFREVGYRERIAQAATGPLRGQWVDTILYELRLDPVIPRPQ